MHITHVNLARGFRGGERQTLNLMEGLRRLGFEQTLVCRKGSEMESRAQEADLPVFPIRHPLTGHLDPHPTNIVHAHEARAVQWAAIEHLARGTPFVITRRIPTPLTRSAITASAYRRAAALFAVSQDVADQLASQVGRNVCTVLSCASEYRVDREAVAGLRRRLGGGPIIGHVGVLNDSHKGQSILIGAFQRLAHRFPDARLVLVGEGLDRPMLERLAAADRRIVFAGQQRDPGPWIAAMDVFAFPSREEGLGSSVLDAMLAGIPVVTSDAGGLSELTGSNRRGLLVRGTDPDAWANAIGSILADPVLRAGLTASAQRFAKEHDLGAMASRYAASYRALLATSIRDISWIHSEGTPVP
jgi:glycosyltransferase involved in cell wall biosynthesis